MSKYRETLYRWAAQHVPEGAKITSVTVDNDPGYYYSEYTHADPSLDIWIDYVLGDEHCRAYVEVESLGDILSELFAIEDES